MKISHLKIENFKAFSSREFLFHEQFNLIVGDNGSGKTGLLDACSVAIGSFLLGIAGAETRHIRSHEVNYRRFSNSSTKGDEIERHRSSWEYQFPCSIEATGVVNGEAVHWKRSLRSATGKTTHGDANAIKRLAFDLAVQVRSGEHVTLPVISYYGTGRLWREPRDSFKVKNAREKHRAKKASRFDGYHTSIDPRLSVSQLTNWIAQESWIAFQSGYKTTPELEILSGAIIGCLDGAERVYYDPAANEVIVEIKGIAQPFSNLSDGQRCMMALVGDVAKKAITLNPHLGSQALAKAQGVILIDELDLHLHPIWQQTLIESLRNTFPLLQFICTTHSSFLIQSLRDGEELLMLEGQPPEKTQNRSIEEISYAIQGVENLGTSVRYNRMKDEAKEILARLYDSDKLTEKEKDDLKDDADILIKKYADNPAYQAFIELNKVGLLGKK